DAQVAHVLFDRREVKRGHGDFSPRKLMDESGADFGGHDGDALHLVLHHSFPSLAGAARIIVGVTEDCVVTELPGPSFKPLDYFGEKRILDVGDDNPKRAAISRREMTRVNVWNVSEAFHRGEYKLLRTRADLASSV